MMLLFLAALTQAPAGPVMNSDVQREVVIMARKLNSWKAKLSEADGKTRCVTTVSSGDRDIDEVGCSAILACVTQLRPRIIASADKRRPRAERTALAAAVNKEMASCFELQREQLLEALADRRFAQRAGVK